MIDTRYYQRGEYKDEDKMSMEHTWEDETRLENVSYNTRKEERTLLLKLILWTPVRESRAYVLLGYTDKIIAVRNDLTML